MDELIKNKDIKFIINYISFHNNYEIAHHQANAITELLVSGKSRSILYNVLDNQSKMFKLSEIVISFQKLLPKLSDYTMIKVILIVNMFAGADHSKTELHKFLKYFYDYNKNCNYRLRRKLSLYTPPDELIPKLDPITEFEEIARSIIGPIMAYLNKNPQMVPSEMSFMYVICNGNLSWKQADDLYEIFLKRGFRPTYEHLSKMGISFLPDDFGNLCNKIFIYLLNNDESAKVKMLANASYFAKIIEVDSSFKLSLEQFHDYIKNKNTIGQIEFKVIELYNKLSEPPTLETLQLICLYNFPNIIDLICQKGIYPDQICFSNSCKNTIYENNLIKLYNYKLFADKQCFINVVRHKHKRDFDRDIEILIKYGFCPDLECVDIAFGYNLIIKNLGIFALPLDDRLYEICFKHNNFPKEYMDILTINKDVIKLRTMFVTETEESIVKFMKDNLLYEADEFCFKNAFKNRNNLMRLLLKLGYNPKLDEIIDIENTPLRKTLYKYLFQKHDAILSLT